MNPAIAVVVLFSSVILFHELGHLVTAKLMGVKVQRFAVGFGPAVSKFKFGETEYVLSMVLLGGYTKLLGEDPNEVIEEFERHRAYTYLPTWKRAVIVVAGALSNIISAVVLLVVVYLSGISALDNVVGAVAPESPAAIAGIQKGDRVTAINGDPVNRWEKAIEAVDRAPRGKLLKVSIERAGTVLEFQVMPQIKAVKDILKRDKQVNYFGIQPSGKMFTHRENLLGAIKVAAAKGWYMVKLVTAAVQRMLLGALPVSELSGPITIFKVVGEQASQGFQHYLFAMAFVSINLGVFNLIPVPALDGGHVIFLIIEAFRKRPLKPKTMLLFQRIGVIFMALLVAFVVYQDLTRLGK